ncbi:MAG TPA: hypothetical protein VFO77_06700, partial [Actinoplanes sp.]|nr:hypothetical protein [Actinoplanes sp.]
QVPVGVLSSDVLVDAKTHLIFLLEWGPWRPIREPLSYAMTHRRHLRPDEDCAEVSSPEIRPGAARAGSHLLIGTVHI